MVLEIEKHLKSSLIKTSIFYNCKGKGGSKLERHGRACENVHILCDNDGYISGSGYSLVSGKFKW